MPPSPYARTDSTAASSASRTPETRRTRYLKRLAALKNERTGQGYDSHWRDIGDFILPRRLRLFTKPANRGQKVSQQIIDSTATLALRTCKSGMMAGMSSPARPWFRLTTSDPELNQLAQVKAYLFEVETRIREVFSKSNLYTVLPVHYGDLAAFGTAVTMMLEDDDTVVRFYSEPLGSYYLANSPRLAIDTIYREKSMTVRQVVEDFVQRPGGGEDWSVASLSLKQAWDAGAFDQWWDVLNVIEPNADYQEGLLDRRGKRYRSCWMECGTSQPQNGDGRDTLLRESGFTSFPALASRWDVLGEDIYGYSPGMDVLGDVKQLQLMQKRKMQAVDKLVNPPMRGPESLRSHRSSLLPGDTTYVDATTNGTGTFEPAYVIKPELQQMTFEMQEIQHRISRGLYEDLFLMLQRANDRQRTAREIEERHEEKLLMLGPVLERQNGELFDPLIDRTFEIMDRRGLLPDPPEILQGRDLKIEYISILAAAQRAVGTAGVERLGNLVLALAPAIPSVMDKFDADEAIDQYNDMLGNNPALVRSDDEVGEVREQREAQVRAAQATAAAKPVADAVKAVGETPMGGDTALTRMLGQSGPQAGQPGTAPPQAA